MRESAVCVELERICWQIGRNLFVSIVEGAAVTKNQTAWIFVYRVAEELSRPFPSKPHHLGEGVLALPVDVANNPS